MTRWSTICILAFTLAACPEPHNWKQDGASNQRGDAFVLPDWGTWSADGSDDSGSGGVGGGQLPPNSPHELWKYPADFPKLKDTGGNGKGELMIGFGGDPTLDQAGNRAALKRTPVILIHGNTATAYGSSLFPKGSDWDTGMQVVADHLRQAGYNASEIWAISYLGKGAKPQMDRCYSTNIEDLRIFADGVRNYLGVKKVDFIAHSLGNGLVQGYLFGLKQRPGSKAAPNAKIEFDSNNHRFDAVGTWVSLVGGNHGTGGANTLTVPLWKVFSADTGEYAPGSLPEGSFDRNVHVFQGVKDDTPFGASNKQKQVSTTKGKDYRHESSLDDNKITYVALWSSNELIQNLSKDAGRLEGADLNKRYEWGPPNPLNSYALISAHCRFLRDKKIFNDFVGYLNRSGGP
jgi:pimeloyl-ACP methyl ester carboxylesterase